MVAVGERVFEVCLKAGKGLEKLAKYVVGPDASRDYRHD